MEKIKIVSYNINGIRSAADKGLSDFIQSEEADVWCFQEIKALENQIPESILHSGFHAYWHPAEKKGYSGVGILTKEKPLHIEMGCGIPWIDKEGRVLRVDFASYSVMSVYMPSGTTGDLRQEVKYRFLDAFYEYIQSLLLDIPNLVVCGDYNICHKPIDIHDPKGNAKSSGFLPEERAWMDKWFNELMEDGFRLKNEDPHQYTWWSFRANSRANNKGWRIDYCSISKTLKPFLSEGFIRPEAKHSDHCPTGIMLNI